jgi:hypothetical protein
VAGGGSGRNRPGAGPVLTWGLHVDGKRIVQPRAFLGRVMGEGRRRVGHRNSGRGLVFMDETAQRVPPVNFRRPQVIDRWPWVTDRRPKVKPAMRPRLVVMPNVGPKDALKVSSADDERPIQAFGTDGALWGASIWLRS